MLNDYFSTCFNNSIPPLSDTDSDTFANSTSSECPPELLCNEEEVLELLLSLDTTEVNGPDEISAVMLKATAHSIAKSVAILFNKSIQSGVVPNEWKLSSVVPIPKAKEMNQPSNYRQISLLLCNQYLANSWRNICTN